MAVCGLTRGSTEEDKVARRAGAIESKADGAGVDADHLTLHQPLLFHSFPHVIYIHVIQNCFV